jgi:hypothetical protein
MQPPADSRDHEHDSLYEGTSRIGLMILWPDGSVSCGGDATDLLRTITGGWNPSSLTGLRRVLAQRAGISPPKRGETNRRFLDRLEAAGMIKIFDVDRHFPEFSEPPFGDAA